jgi:large subunit ribosomal protein L22
MIAKAIARHVRMTARKVDYVAVPLRQKTVASALAQLSVGNRKAARPLSKLIASAFANARQQHPELREEDLVITKLTADQGPTWKRFRAAAFGRAARILKRTSHITVELDRPGAHAAPPTAPRAAAPAAVKAPQPAAAAAGAGKTATKSPRRSGTKSKTAVKA